MRVDVRLYRRHDPDLMMLKSYGIDIPALIRVALLHYVKGERVKYRLPGSKPCDVTGVPQLRYRFEITDRSSVDVLKNIKRYYRNQFLKQLLRDVLDVAPLGVYFASDPFIKKENERVCRESSVAELVIGNVHAEEKGAPSMQEISAPLKELLREMSGKKKQKKKPGTEKKKEENRPASEDSKAKELRPKEPRRTEEAVSAEPETAGVFDDLFADEETDKTPETPEDTKKGKNSYLDMFSSMMT